MDTLEFKSAIYNYVMNDGHPGRCHLIHKPHKRRRKIDVFHFCGFEESIEVTNDNNIVFGQQLTPHCGGTEFKDTDY